MSAADYAAHYLTQTALQAVFGAASAASEIASASSKLFGMGQLAREFSAIGAMCDRASRDYAKPAFNLPSTVIDGRDVAVREEIVASKPYGNLVRFSRDTDRNDPKLLLVAPMSGHYATLLRGTVEALLPNHDVHITDWTNARDVPRKHGGFGLDQYVQYIDTFLDKVGPNSHVMAVCQPTIPVLAAVAQKAARGDEIQPLTMTLIGGPIDTRAAPTSVTRFAENHSMDYFERKVVTEVPPGFAGAGQIVHAGHKQLAGFVWMNPDRHITSHQDLFNHLRRGDQESAHKIRTFYDEYLAVMDIPGRFYLETVDEVFKRQTLARGQMARNGIVVDPGAITRTALLTIEGEKDDISAPGQTKAAHGLCANIAPDRQYHHLQPGVGHYGTFEGRRWREEICPRIAGFIRHGAAAQGLSHSAPSGKVMLPDLVGKEIHFTAKAKVLAP